MKNKIYFTLLILLIGFSSCESFLEEDPKDIISPSNFFSSESDARAALTGVYAILKNNAIYGQVGLDAWYENGADVVGPNRGWGIIASICGYTMNEGNAGDIQQLMGIAQTWKDLYKIVLNTNVILANVEGNENILSGPRDEIVGEAASIYANLYTRGAIIGDADILITATAKVHGLAVSTNNRKHFARIEGIELINWLEGSS